MIHVLLIRPLIQIARLLLIRAGGILQVSYVMTPVIDALLISTAKSFQPFETYVVEGNVCFIFLWSTCQ